MKFNVDEIELILIEQDPEGLIDMGAPSDEYSNEAKMIYNRISNEGVKNYNDILVKIIGVFIEQFGSSSSYYRSGELIPEVKVSENYINQYRYNILKNISKLICDSAEEE